MKKYRLLQTLLMPGHLPIILPIGYEVNLKGDLYIGEGGWYFAKTGVENNKLHWEEVKPVEKERIEVNLRHHTYGGELVVETGRLISDEYFPAIKKAIEQVLNPEPSSKKEEGWEILTYINPYVITDIKDGNVVKPNIYATLRDYPIHSVLKKSDNTVFTVGDEVGWDLLQLEGQTKTLFRIESFQINDMLESKRMFCNNQSIDIEYLEKAPTKTIEKHYGNTKK